MTARPVFGGALHGPVAVIGFAVTGQAVARVLGAMGLEIVAVEDAPTPERRAAARSAGIGLVMAPDEGELAAAVGPCELVVVSPGVNPAILAICASMRDVVVLPLVPVMQAIGTRAEEPAGNNMSMTGPAASRGVPSLGATCIRNPGAALTSQMPPPTVL